MSSPPSAVKINNNKKRFTLTKRSYGPFQCNDESMREHNTRVCAGGDSRYFKEFKGPLIFFMCIQLMKNLKSYRLVYKTQRPDFKSPDNNLVSFSKWGISSLQKS